ncbi:hypothetical protein [Mycobacteroides chelonae]|nr:hypothetical protein [Mycobacteroides chelonae]
MLNLRTIQFWKPLDFDNFAQALMMRAQVSESVATGLLEIRRSLEVYSGDGIATASQRYREAASAMDTESDVLSQIRNVAEIVSTVVREIHPDVVAMYEWSTGSGVRNRVDDEDGTIIVEPSAPPEVKATAQEHQRRVQLALQKARMADEALTKVLQVTVGTEITVEQGRVDRNSRIDVDPTVLQKIAKATIDLEATASTRQRGVDQGTTVAHGLSWYGPTLDGMQSFAPYRAFAVACPTDWLCRRRKARSDLLTGLASSLYVVSALFENTDGRTAEQLARIT